MQPVLLVTVHCCISLRSGESPRPAQFEEGAEQQAGGVDGGTATAGPDEAANGGEAKVVSLISPATEMDGHRQVAEQP